MPRTDAQNIPHVAWTDHRILPTPGVLDLQKPAADTHEDLTPIFSPGASPRDLALATYQAVMRGRSHDREKAYDLLMKAHQSSTANDVPLLNALGVLSAARGDDARASAYFSDVLKLEPEDLTAASNLGVLRARAGDLHGAMALLGPAFRRNEDVIGLAKNLSTIQCMAGDQAAARNTLETTLRYSPAATDILAAVTAPGACSPGSEQRVQK